MFYPGLLSDSDLVTSTHNSIKNERVATSVVLQHLQEIDARKIFLKEGYASLYKFTIRALGYSDAAAYRRISAMRLLKQLPELKESLDEGKLNLTQIASAHTFFQRQAKSGVETTQEEKVQLVQELSGKTTRECERKFMSIAPETSSPDRIRPISESHIEIRFVASEPFMQKLNRYRELNSHSLHNASIADVFERLIDSALLKQDRFERGKKPSPGVTACKHTAQSSCGSVTQPVSASITQPVSTSNTKAVSASITQPLSTSITQPLSTSTTQPVSTSITKPVSTSNTKAVSASVNQSVISSGTNAEQDAATRELSFSYAKTPAPGVDSLEAISNNYKLNETRSIPIEVKRAVWLRDQGCCTFKSSGTQKICGSKYQLQYDHIVPYAAGGTHHAQNLRLRCRNHNLLHAEEFYGAEKMKIYRKAV